MCSLALGPVGAMHVPCLSRMESAVSCRDYFVLLQVGYEPPLSAREAAFLHEQLQVGFKPPLSAREAAFLHELQTACSLRGLLLACMTLCRVFVLVGEELLRLL